MRKDPHVQSSGPAPMEIDTLLQSLTKNVASVPAWAEEAAAGQERLGGGGSGSDGHEDGEMGKGTSTTS